MLWIVTALFGFVFFFCFRLLEVPPPPSQSSTFEEKELTFVTEFSEKAQESSEEESYEKTVVETSLFSEEEYEELYALQDSFQSRPLKAKPYGKTYGIKWDGRYFIYGVEVKWDQYHLHLCNDDIDYTAFQYREEKKELKKKKRQSNRKKTLRDHRR